MMSKEIDNTKALAESHALEFKDCGGGHVQIKGHGVLVNYWPDSKNRTAHVVGGESVKHCNPYDAIKLCQTGKKVTLRPKKKPSKHGPDFDPQPVVTNPAGLKHFYTGERPPWEYPTMIVCQPDLLRLQAHELRDQAIYMEAEQ